MKYRKPHIMRVPKVGAWCYIVENQQFVFDHLADVFLALRHRETILKIEKRLGLR